MALTRVFAHCCVRRCRVSGVSGGSGLPGLETLVDGDSMVVTALQLLHPSVADASISLATLHVVLGLPVALPWRNAEPQTLRSKKR
eukprot:IDg10682t1